MIARAVGMETTTEIMTAREAMTETETETETTTERERERERRRQERGG